MVLLAVVVVVAERCSSISVYFSDQMELFMKGQADPVQEDDDVAEDPDTVASVDCDVVPMNGNAAI